MPLAAVYFIAAGFAFAGLVLGGWCRNSKLVDAWYNGYDRGYSAGVGDERCRGRKAIYEAFDEGYKRGKVDTEDAIPQIVLEGV